MAQPVTAILSHQNALAEKALRFTGDINEASLLVGKVMSKAFHRLAEGAPNEAVSESLGAELDALIRKLRRRPS